MQSSVLLVPSVPSLPYQLEASFLPDLDLARGASLSQARLSEARAWSELVTVLHDAYAQASVVSIHRGWLRDVLDCLESPEASTWHRWAAEADRLCRLNQRYRLYAHEAERVRAVARAASDYARALHTVTECECDRYESCVSHRSHRSY